MDCDSDSSLPDTQTPCSENILKSQEKQEPEIPWGKLYSTIVPLKPVELSKTCFVLGRAEDCDVMLSKHNFPSSLLGVVSKSHFVITRIVKSNIVVLTDLSKNGTFVNEHLIGRDKTVTLQNDDVISIGTRKTKIYVYKTIQSQEDSYLPPELRCKYEVSRLLGNGAFGEVKLVFEKTTCCEYAVKKIIKKVEKEKENQSNRIQAEINILKRLSHPFIVSAREMVETDNAVFIILEYMQGGELTDYINSPGKPLSEKIVKFLFLQIILGVQYLHKEGITHRDLKPENVLLKSNAIENTLVKISDFGLSKIIDETVMMATVCGTSYYIAPEILDVNCTNYSQQVDIWSLGVILFYMLSQDLPFRAQNQGDLFKVIILGTYFMHEDKWRYISSEAQNLIQKMLHRDPKTRITIHEVVDHPWIVQDENVYWKVKQLMNKGFVQTKGLCANAEVTN